MKNTIYVLDLDNYYSRKFQIEYNSPGIDVVGLYLEHAAYREVSINFNPNDGISTTIVLNCQEWQVGNYAIVVNENNELVSRWFIMEAVRIREGQYRINLRRDVVMDYWRIISKSPALIEKADLSYDDPLIFNNENFIVNQIKTSETLLKDITGCPWLVAYIAKDASSGLTGTVQVNSEEGLSAIPINNTIESWQQDKLVFYGDYVNVKYRIQTDVIEYYYDVNALNGNAKYVMRPGRAGSSLHPSGLLWLPFSVEKAIKNGLVSVGIESLKEMVPSYTSDRHTKSEEEEFLSLNGKLIIDTNDKIFKVNIRQVKQKSISYDITAGSLFYGLSKAVEDASTRNEFGVTVKAFSGSPNSKTFQVVATYNEYNMTLEPQPLLTASYDLTAPRLPTSDAAYDIIAIPYGITYFLINGQATVWETNKEVGLSTIQAIAKNMDAGCYDIQLLPYCPVPDLIFDLNGFLLTDPLQYSLIKQGENNVGIIFNVPRANFTFNIFNNISAAASNIQRKINNDCDKWRLSSPNYANYFDFSAEKNNGVQYFNVDCCYKPYNPYIHINPNFNGLYGQDFNDPRGLVCGGDFSLTQVKSAWEAYELQNKNYQQTFDRQIQNMEFNNKYQSIQDQVQAVTGAISGTVSGAATGLMVGGPQGAIAGGAVGGVASTAGGIADVLINQKLRNEAIDYTMDQFGYSLGNIRAIPLTLSKISAFNANNKVFPVLEYYTCTDREKEAYANKIAYNGMTVMAIGKIEDYITNPWEYTINESVIKSKTYIKAKLIHLDMFEDYHIAREIASEINKGIFIEVIE